MHWVGLARRYMDLIDFVSTSTAKKTVMPVIHSQSPHPALLDSTVRIVGFCHDIAFLREIYVDTP